MDSLVRNEDKYNGILQQLDNNETLIHSKKYTQWLQRSRYTEIYQNNKERNKTNGCMIHSIKDNILIIYVEFKDRTIK